MDARSNGRIPGAPPAAKAPDAKALADAFARHRDQRAERQQAAAAVRAAGAAADKAAPAPADSKAVDKLDPSPTKPAKGKKFCCIP